MTSNAFALATGVDYRLLPNVTVGVALGGGTTSWDVSSRLGYGSGEFLQTGVYGLADIGDGYVSAAFAFANHWMTTTRFAAFDQTLKGQFVSQNYSGRLEGGYRLPVSSGTIVPYGALQSQTAVMPGFTETADTPLADFGLTYRSGSSVNTRTEFGSHFEHALSMSGGAQMLLRGTAAWVHNWERQPRVSASFTALPGSYFTVEGARLPKDAALVRGTAEMRMSNGVSFFGKLDGEFASRAQSYSGSVGLRMRW